MAETPAEYSIKRGAYQWGPKCAGKEPNCTRGGDKSAGQQWGPEERLLAKLM